MQVIPSFIGALTLAFFLIRMIPGDPVLAIVGDFATPAEIETMRSRLGLDRPIMEQYFSFLGGVLRGDLGRSLHYEQPVLALAARAIPHTLRLATAAIIITVVLGVPLGVIAAVRRNTVADVGVLVMAMTGISIPSFWLGLLMLWLFAGVLGWFPLTGPGPPGDVVKMLHHLFLPAVVLGVSGAALVTRMTRSCVLEVLGQEYIRTARAKGLGDRVLLYRHALRNALIPVVTIVGLNLGHLVAGTVLVETVFTRPGLGTLMVDSIFSRDYPMVQGIVVLFSLLFITVNLLVDLTYGLLDPRIRYR